MVLPEFIPFEKAAQIIQSRIQPLKSCWVAPWDCGLKVAAADVRAKTNRPSAHVSTRDGFGVRASDTHPARQDAPKKLVCTKNPDQKEAAVPIMTGQPVPPPADAVVPDEWTVTEDSFVWIKKPVTPGQHVRPLASDVAAGDLLVEKGGLITPLLAGLAAECGQTRIQVHLLPNVTVLATGDEVRQPGDPLGPGDVASGNPAVIRAWLLKYGWTCRIVLAPDDPVAIQGILDRAAASSDALVISGGTGKGGRDVIFPVLEKMGWDAGFRGVALRPGKGFGFGLLGEKPVFILPGTPTANAAAFVLLALPGLLRLAGRPHPRLFGCLAGLSTELPPSRRGARVWFGRLFDAGDRMVFAPAAHGDGLTAWARSNAVFRANEGQGPFEAGSLVCVDILI